MLNDDLQVPSNFSIDDLQVDCLWDKLKRTAAMIAMLKPNEEFVSKLPDVKITAVAHYSSMHIHIEFKDLKEHDHFFLATDYKEDLPLSKRTFVFYHHLLTSIEKKL